MIAVSQVATASDRWSTASGSELGAERSESPHTSSAPTTTVSQVATASDRWSTASGSELGAERSEVGAWEVGA